MIRINNSQRSFASHKHSFASHKRSLLVRFAKSKNLALFSGLFLLLGTLLLFTLQKFSPLIGHVAYYCQSLLIDANMVPIPYYLSVIPFAFLLIILAISVIKLFILNLNVQFLKLKLKGNITINYDTNKLIKRLGLKDKAVLVKSDKQFAFCLGVRNPTIYFSTGLLSNLTIKELEAVLRHEQYHLENHDTFTMIVASVAHSLFPFFPLVSDLIKKYRIDREIEADKFAVSKIGDQDPLISALKKLLAFPTVGTVAVAAIADHDTLEPRIRALVQKDFHFKKFKAKRIFISILSIFVMSIIALAPVQAVEVRHVGKDVIMICPNNSDCLNACRQTYSISGKNYSEDTPYSLMK